MPPGPAGVTGVPLTGGVPAPGLGRGGMPGFWMSIKLMYFFQPVPWQLMFAQKLWLSGVGFALYLISPWHAAQLASTCLG